MKTETRIGRRRFLRTSALLAGGSAFALSGAAAQEPLESGPNIIGPREGYSPHVGTLVSMLEWMRAVVVREVEGLAREALDYLHDGKANTIGALLLHLAATERLYQVHTFEGKKWGDFDGETKRRWVVPMNLGHEARRQIKGHDLSHYLDALRQVREQTVAELRKRDDAWLLQVDRDWSWGPTNNYCKWFHVCEHESNHNGQIRWIKRRLPTAGSAED